MKARAVTAAIALVWLGMLIGVSFLATPAKFATPGLSFPLALDVGRYTFAVYSKVESGLAVALLVAALITGKRGLLAVAVLTGIAVAMQVLWLLPALDARVEIILGGGTPPPSPLHWIYIGLDGLKVLLLGVAAFLAWRAV